MKKIFSSLAVLAFIAQPAFALDLLDDAEIKADATLTNQFFHGVAGSNNDHDAFVDYRVEGKFPIYKLSEHEGSLYVRVEGLAPVDNNIDKFFRDPLIDIPEIFVRDDYADDDREYMTVFGKFANRRFFDKQELYNDPFDIGERRSPAAIEGTLSLLNLMNEFRDSNDQFQSRIASGSYGFVLGVKDSEGTGLLSRWGAKQALAVTEMNQFGNSFYGISELNKNWGEKGSAGQFDMGLVYAGSQAYRFSNPDSTTYVLYASFAQEMGKFTPYTKWGSMWFDDLAGSTHNINEWRLGATHRTTDKDQLAMHLAWFDGEALGANNTSVLINTWRHAFNDHIASWLYYIQEFNQFNTAATGTKDNSWTAGLNFNLIL